MCDRLLQFFDGGCMDASLNTTNIGIYVVCAHCECLLVFSALLPHDFYLVYLFYFFILFFFSTKEFINVCSSAIKVLWNSRGAHLSMFFRFVLHFLFFFFHFFCYICYNFTIPFFFSFHSYSLSLF